MTHDEKKASILAVARKYPHGIERKPLLAESGVKHDSGFRLITALRKEGELFRRQTLDRRTLFTAMEHKATLLADWEGKKPAAPEEKRREWPSVSAWTPPQPRIPSVWHLAQL